MRTALVTACATLTLLAAPAMACVPTIYTDPKTGETYASGSPEALRRAQEGWRQRAKVVVMAQARSGQMISSFDIDYTLAPFATVYGGDVPQTDFRIRWSPGSSCNSFEVGLGGVLILFVGADGEIVGFTDPKSLQDKPPTVDDELRNLRRSKW
jgi:hypothetical protein